MPTASQTNNIIAQLAASVTVPGKLRAEESVGNNLFEQSLNRQMQSRQNEQLARDAQVSKPVQQQAKPLEAVKPVAVAKPAEPAKQPEKAAEPSKVAETPEQTTPASDQPATRGAGQERSDAPDQDKVAEGSAEQAAAAGMVAQLQVYVDRGLAALQAEAEVKGDPLLQHAGLAQALLDGREAVKDKSDKSFSQQLLGEATDKLAGLRQDLPQADADAMLLDQVASGFQAALDQKLASTDAATLRQQSGTAAIRMELPRSHTTESTRGSAYAIHQPVGSEGWDRAVGNKVVMMVSNQQQEVEMHLNPPHLGPMEVKLTLNQDQATLTFFAAQAPVREALQASMPRLSEMLAESGIQLNQAHVESQAGQGGQGQDDRSGRHAGRSFSAQTEEVQAPANTWRVKLPPGLPGNVNLFV